MKTLIVKIGATGDVVRTTSILSKLEGDVTWITAEKNLPYIQNLSRPVRSVSWDFKEAAAGVEYDLAINLEDTIDVAEFVQSLEPKQIFGAVLRNDILTYTKDASAWFDLSLISRFGREGADKLKLQNRRTYQDLIFEGLGFGFNGEQYYLPPSGPTGLDGDIAIAMEAGTVWPMKKWAFYPELRERLCAEGFKVNVLPHRKTLLEHLSDVRGHKVLVGGDTLPMHLALGSNVKCISIFNCTSPWEIYEYGLQTKIISPLLTEFFYKRTFDQRATTAVPLETVYSAVRQTL
jgi:heptosyltransferase II